MVAIEKVPELGTVVQADAAHPVGAGVGVGRGLPVEEPLPVPGDEPPGVAPVPVEGPGDPEPCDPGGTWPPPVGHAPEGVGVPTVTAETVVLDPPEEGAHEVGSAKARGI